MRSGEPDEHQRADEDRDGSSGTTQPPLDNEHDHHADDEDQEI